jgi:hypothetical protein
MRDASLPSARNPFLGGRFHGFFSLVDGTRTLLSVPSNRNMKNLKSSDYQSEKTTREK